MQVWMLSLGREIYRGALDYCNQLPSSRFFEVTPFPYQPDELIHQGQSYEMAGLIAPIVDPSFGQTILEQGRLCVSTHIGYEAPGIPQVDADHYATGRMAAEHLLNAGFENFAFVGDDYLNAMRLRRQGFFDALEEQGHTAERFLYRITLFTHIAQPDHPVETWLSDLPKPVAIYCSDDRNAMFINNRCRLMGYKVPDDIALLGTEDDDLVCEGMQPSLSSVHLPYRRIGYEAARVMVDWLETGSPPMDPVMLSPDYVQVRASTDVLALEDKKLARAVRYLRDHCTDPIRIEDVADEVGMSLRMLQRKFKTDVGHTPVQELQQARVERVKGLLRQTSLSLDAIAERTGYPNANYLCENFRRITGESPGTYRKKHRVITG